MKTLEGRMMNFAKKYNLSVMFRSLKFGFVRAEFDFEDEAQMEMAKKHLRRMKNLHVVDKKYYHVGFSGYIHVMLHSDYLSLADKLQAQQESNEAWWQRFHTADPDTRRRMACGEIS